MELNKIKTNLIAEYFGVTNDFLIKTMKKFNINSEKKKNLNYGFSYVCDVNLFTYDCLKELEKKSKIKFETIKNFLEDFTKHHTDIQNNIKRERDIKRGENLKIKNDLKDKFNISSEESEIYKKEITDIWYSNKDTEYIIHVGPTNSGKTYHAIKDLVESDSGIYLSPLRLLAYEVYENLSKDNINCDLITGEDVILNNSSISSRTTEMMDYENEYETVILDECSMLEDSFRGKSWLKAIIYSKCKRMYLITSPDGLSIIKNILKNLNRKFVVKQHERLSPVEFSNEKYNLNKVKDKTVFIVFSRIDVLYYKTFFEEKGHSVSILYGNLPPDVKKNQIKRFIDGETNICVSTDVIGMGINIPCDNIVFLQTNKYDGISNRFLKESEIKQIGGRAGRYGLSKDGRVYSNQNTPKMKELFYKNHSNITKTYIPIDINLLKKFPFEKLSEKLSTYSKLNIVPENLKNIISSESISNYLNIMKSNGALDNMDIDDAWNLLNLLIYNSTDKLYSDLIHAVKNKKIHTYYVNYSMNNDKIKSQHELQMCEDFVRNIDLMISFHNNKHFKQYTDLDNITEIRNKRSKIIELINSYLLQKRLKLTKRCKDCKCDMDLLYPHAICQDCYNVKNNYRYFMNMDDDFDDDDW